MDVLIVENDLLVARVLKDLVEVTPNRRVTDIAANLGHALESISRQTPHVALLDINLAGGATGIEVASKLRQLGILSLFTTSDPLPFPVPELAVGCLCKPYNSYNVERALSIVAQIISGYPVNIEIPIELEIY